jgi:mycoredoxin
MASESEIHVYGTDWCSLTFGVREFLTNGGFPYDYHDVDRDPQAHAFLLALTDGRRRFPVVVVHERVLANPTRTELQRVLDDYRIHPQVRARRPRLL